MTEQPESDALPELRTVSEAARFLHVSTQQVRRLIRTGKLPAFDIGLGDKSTFRLDQRDLNRFLADRTHKH